MELETINRLYLELSQIATAKTKRELDLEDLLISARAIAERKGKETAWGRFSERLAQEGIGSVTAKTFRVLAGDKEQVKALSDALRDAISTFGDKSDVVVTEERKEAWLSVLREHGDAEVIDAPRMKR